jgi:deazaflavin-dependent oxidoreductase (nitroreductase family)
MRRRALVVLGVAVLGLVVVALVLGLHDMASLGDDGPSGRDTSVRERLARVGARPTLRLTHRGRKTGREYAVTIWFATDGDTVYLTTMDRRRQWVRNALQTPRVVLQVGPERFEGTLAPVTDDAEKRREYGLLIHKYWIMRVMDTVIRLTGRDPETRIGVGRGGFFRVALAEPAASSDRDRLRSRTGSGLQRGVQAMCCTIGEGSG